ncbi:PAS domain-containing sensor histidine kinase [Henriciella sp.]|uniref:PAS domain-containing sensor histidine kinase n=1 Tax=Henriciella sp. TaxID=1968823 RepID=UPI002604C178|nr:PAS domain-containing sensor histidine kinase [Henriciella sp.]
MALTRQTTRSVKDRGSQRSGAGFGRILLLTLILLAGVLGLMLWNNFQARKAEELQILQRDTLLLGASLNRKVDRAGEYIENEIRAGSAIREISAQDAGLDRIASLDTALESRNDTLVQAARKAAELSAEGQRVTLLDDGRLVISYQPTVGTAIVASVEARHWLQAPDRDSRVLLYGDAAVSSGNRSVLPPSRELVQQGNGFRYKFPLTRSATSCAALAGADFSLCLSRNSPLVTPGMGLNLLLGLFAVIAAALALMGVYRQSGRSAPLVEAARSPGSQENSLEASATNAALGFWTLRPEDGQAWISDTAARLLGWPDSGEISRAAFLGSFSSSHHDSIMEALAEAGTGTPFSIQAPTRASDGGKWMELRGSREAGGVNGRSLLSGVVMDVTASMRLRERQRTADTRLRNAIESFPCPFALFDNNRRLFFWNRAYEELFDLSSVLRPGAKHETVAIARSAQASSESASQEDSATTLIGLKSNIWIKLVEQTTAAGTLVSFGIDVTNDVRNEHQLQQQQKKLKTLVQDLEKSEGHKAELARKYNEEKGRAEKSANSKSAFLANMSHELRTPLNAINGFSEILVNEMYGPLGDKRYGEYAKDILTSGRHLLDMINDILDIAKIEAGKMTIDPKPVDLVDPVDAAVRMIRRKAEDKGIRLEMRTEEGLPNIDADHRAVRQMVLNLLSNAIKFTDAGGRITVAVQRRGDFIRVAVRDTGVGIPKEHLPRLANPFEQVQETRERNTDGTGLGLALTKSFAEMHGGKLTLASEPGKGTMVSIFLPVNTGEHGHERNVA